MSKRILYVADDEVVLLLDGLRWIKKVDFPQFNWGLGWDFGGRGDTVIYKDKVKRDAIFERVSQALLSRNPEPGSTGPVYIDARTGEPVNG